MVSAMPIGRESIGIPDLDGDGNMELDQVMVKYRQPLLQSATNLQSRLYNIVQRNAQLVKIVDDPAVAVTIPEVRGPVAEPTPLTPRILKPIEKLADEMWPGVPVIPALEPGASDAQFLNPAGIPTYGVTGFFQDADYGNIHGLNERIRVRSVYEGRTFLYRLVKVHADQ
jgi:acetylornithine deacetylase/succinyl-diaminopimelate desuccinylase-like protein